MGNMTLYDLVMERCVVTAEDYQRLGNGEISDEEEIKRILATPYDEIQERSSHD
jgi:hypothetical protein